MIKSLLFSVLVPNYGYSPLIFECLDSIVSQKKDNLFDFEILVCDQSNCDTYNRLKKEIFQRYGDTVSIYHSAIKSLYKARINLIKESNGEYFIFVDSDDKLLDSTLIKLYKIISSTNKLDLYQFKLFGEIDSIYAGKTMNKESYLNYFLSERGTYPIVKKCIKKKEFSFYDEDIFLAEDALISLCIILNLNSFYISNDECYYYRENAESGTKKLNAENLNELSLFLNYSIPYRLTEESKSELVFSFIKTYIDIYSSCFFDYKILNSGTKNIICLIDGLTYKTKPFFLKATFNAALKNKKSVFKFNLLCLNISLKLCKILHFESYVRIKG